MTRALLFSRTLVLLPLFAAVAHSQVVITEIMYNSFDESFKLSEWIEIYNDSDSAVDLEDWQLIDEKYLVTGEESDRIEQFKDGDFHGGVVTGSSILVPGEVALIIPFGRGVNDFRASWNLPPTTKVIAPKWGNTFDLDNRPAGDYDLATGELSGNGRWPSILLLQNAAGQNVDIVDYRNNARGWPDTGGYTQDGSFLPPKGGSIYLRTASVLADDPSLANDNGRNWAISVAGQEGAYNQTPTSIIFSPNDVGSPGRIYGVEVAIPEPAAMSFLVGLCCLVGWRRRS